MDWKDPEQVREYHRAHYKEYYQNNKEKKREYGKEYYQKNKEKQKEYTREYYQKNKEKKTEYAKEYYQKNIEKQRKHRRNWKKNNPALILQHKANRRARKIRAIPAWLKDCSIEKRRVYTVYLLSRSYAKADGIERHVDHMVPLSDGGPHWSGNLQILTKEENLEKGAYSCPKLKKQMKLNLKEAKVLYAKAA
jgi:hypothetical protein